MFSVANGLAVIMWAALLVMPRRPALLAAVMYLGVGLLCLAYAGLAIAMVAGGIDPVRDAGLAPVDWSNYSVAGLMDFFRSQGAVTIGWIHYLAFDLFAGLWIARDADAKGFSRIAQAPVLVATFLAGPIGLGIWLLVRERRARAGGRWH